MAAQKNRIRMGRSRRPIPGGYRRTTLSLPGDLVEEVEQLLRDTEVSLSAFFSAAGREHLRRELEAAAKRKER